MLSGVLTLLLSSITALAQTPLANPSQLLQSCQQSGTYQQDEEAKVLDIDRRDVKATAKWIVDGKNYVLTFNYAIEQNEKALDSQLSQETQTTEVIDGVTVTHGRSQNLFIYLKSRLGVGKIWEQSRSYEQQGGGKGEVWAWKDGRKSYLESRFTDTTSEDGTVSHVSEMVNFPTGDGLHFLSFQAECSSRAAELASPDSDGWNELFGNRMLAKQAAKLTTLAQTANAAASAYAACSVDCAQALKTRADSVGAFTKAWANTFEKFRDNLDGIAKARRQAEEALRARRLAAERLKKTAQARASNGGRGGAYYGYATMDEYRRAVALQSLEWVRRRNYENAISSIASSLERLKR